MFNLYDYNTRSELVDAVRYFRPYSVENVGGQVGSSTNDTGNPVGLQDQASHGFALTSWSYSYDPPSPLRQCSGLWWTGNIPLRPVERDYAGQVGNRTGTTKANASADYTANALNQYTERTVHGSSDIIGSAETNVIVTVNTNTATRQGHYWYHRLGVDNLYTAAYPQVVVEAVFDPGTNDPYVVSSETGNVFVAASPEEFSYDDDGNLLSDGRFAYTWDCENRLVAATTIGGLPEDVPILHIEFEYDYMSRRTGKTVHEWDATSESWILTSDSSFLYDGWNLISEVGRTGPGEPSTHSIQGTLNINPNNSPQSEFVLTLADGSAITRDDLISSFAGYSGPAAGIHLKPKGSGKQNNLLVDGEPFELDNAATYDITSDSMTVRLYNDRVDKKGKAMGRWFIEIAATNATIVDADTPAPPSAVTNFYVWGLDLSGSLQGAGGIGGLLAVVQGTNAYFPTFDGNGNVSEYLDASGDIVAHYEYSPFGETVVSTGPMKDDFAFRFSTKYFDPDTGLYYYGYRYYNPALGRWLNPDPIGERGGLNLFLFIGNDSINNADLVGLLSWEWTPFGMERLSGNLHKAATQTVAPLGVTTVIFTYTLHGTALLTRDPSTSAKDCYTDPWSLTGHNSWSFAASSRGIGFKVRTSISNGPATGSLSVAYTTWLLTTSMTHDYSVRISPVKRLHGGCCYKGSAVVGLSASVDVNNAAIAAAVLSIVTAYQTIVGWVPELIPVFQPAIAGL